MQYRKQINIHFQSFFFFSEMRKVNKKKKTSTQLFYFLQHLNKVFFPNKQFLCVSQTFHYRSRQVLVKDVLSQFVVLAFCETTQACDVVRKFADRIDLLFQELVLKCMCQLKEDFKL